MQHTSAASQWCQLINHSCGGRLLLAADTLMALSGCCRTLAGDHTFRAAKYIRQQGGAKAYEAVYTVMNELGQVVGQWFVHTKSLCEVEESLRKLRERFRRLGQVRRMLVFISLCFALMGWQVRRWPVFISLCFALTGGASGMHM